MRYQHALTGFRQIRHGSSVFIQNQGADGNLQDHVYPRMAGTVGAFTVTSTFRFEFAVVAIAQQSIVVGIGFHENAAAVAAIAAGRSAARHKLLTTKRHAAVAAVAGFYQYFCFVDKHSGRTSWNAKNTTVVKAAPPGNSARVGRNKKRSQL